MIGELYCKNKRRTESSSIFQWDTAKVITKIDFIEKYNVIFLFRAFPS